MGKSGSKSLGARNTDRRNGKASKKNPQSNPESKKGRGGYSFKGRFPEKAEAWNYLEKKRSRSEARKFKAKLLEESRRISRSKKEKKAA